MLQRRTVETPQGSIEGRRPLGSVGSGQDVADVGIGTVARIEALTAGDEMFELGCQCVELASATPNVFEFGVQQLCHVPARHDAVVAEIDDAADLPEREPGCLRNLDEAQTVQGRVVVDAIPVGLSSGRRQQALALVEPDGLAGQTNRLGKLSDQHALESTLDLVAQIKVYGRCMEIALLYFDGCPNWKIAEDRLTVIAAERSDISVTHHLVESVDEAERWGFHGSPSILVDGVDLFADVDAGVGLSCRVYQTSGGPSGAPTVEQLREAIARA